MNLSLRAHRARPMLLLAASALALLAPQVQGRARAAEGKAGPFLFQADRVDTPGGIESGSLRLDGNVRLYTPDPKASPQVDLSAPLITADSIARPRRVRGQGGVSFKYSGVRPPIKAGEPGVPVGVQAQAREVLLETAEDGRRTLTLLGDLSGFYLLGTERTELSGQKAVITFGRQPNDVQAAFEGGAEGFDFSLPEQNFGSLPLGRVNLRGGRVSLNQANNTARLEGGARLLSEGDAKLQISGAAFDAAFATQTVRVGGRDVETRRLSRLSSAGRVSLSLALPPEGIGTSATGAQDATYPLSASSAILRLVPQTAPAPAPLKPPLPAQPQANTASAPQKPETSLVPVRIEISADSAVIEPGTATQPPTLTLTGNVRGSYVLREVLSASRPPRVGEAADPTAPAPVAGATGKAASPPLSLDLDIRGAQIQLPATFSFEL